MSPVNPLAWMWSLLAIPIIACYILKVRLRRQTVATLMFWEQAYEESKPRSIWRTMRHPLSLLLQLIVLLLLVVALSDPRGTSGSSAPRRLVVVIDHSASMAVVEDGRTRLDSSLAEVRGLIRGLRSQDEMAIISAGASVRLRCGLTNHHATLRKTLTEIKQTDAAADLQAAVATAERLLGEHPHARSLVITDEMAAKAMEQSSRVEWRQVGTSQDNVAITSFQVRRSEADPTGYDLLVEVGNFSTETFDGQLSLFLVDYDQPLIDIKNVDDASILDAIPLNIAPGERWRKVLSESSQRGGRLIAHLPDTDSLASDNVAVALVPGRTSQTVYLVADSGWFLPRALQSLPLVDLKVVPQLPATLPSDVMVVFYRRLPPDDFDGDALVIDPRGNGRQWTAGDTLSDPLIAPANETHPILRHVHFENVLASGARKLSWKDITDVRSRVLLKTADDAPVLVTFEQGQRRMVFLTADLEKGDFALRTSFPILMTNAVNWLQHRTSLWRPALGAGRSQPIEVGELLSDDESASMLLNLRHAAGRTLQVTANNGQLRIPPLPNSGLWTLEHDSSDKPLLEVACNLCNERESDLRRGSAPLAADDTGPSAIVGRAGWPLWVLFLLVGVGLISVEWWAHQRRYVE